MQQLQHSRIIRASKPVDELKNLIFIVDLDSPTIKLLLKKLLEIPEILLQDRDIRAIFNLNILCCKKIQFNMQKLLCHYSSNLNKSIEQDFSQNFSRKMNN